MTNEDDADDGIFESSASKDPRYSAVFEDNCEVAYGHLVRDGEILSHVWLYNNDDTATRFNPVLDGNEVSFVWAYGEGGFPVAVVSGYAAACMPALRQILARAGAH